MNTIKFGAALISTMALLSAGFAALAQQPPTPPFKGAAIPQPKQQPRTQPQGANHERNPGDYLVMLPVDVLDMYLKLTKEQTGKISPILKKVKTEQNKFLGMGTNGVPDKDKLEAQFKVLAETVRDSEKEVDGMLTAEQKKKTETMFEEVRKLNFVGIQRDVIGEVKLTDDQKKKLLTLSEEYQKKRAEIKPEDRQTEAPKLGREYRDKAAAMLTDEQKQVVEKARQNNQLPRRPKAP